MSGIEPLIPAVIPRPEKTPAQQVLVRVGQLRAVTWFLVNVGRHVDPLLMKWSNGRLNLTGQPVVVILHHIGARSGKRRTTPLLYFTRGRDVILVASNGGSTHHPAWLHNVRANPEVELWVGRLGGPHAARIAQGGERDSLWGQALEMNPGFDSYRTHAGAREIKIVVCSPTNPTDDEPTR